jgi:CrcB protein
VTSIRRPTTPESADLIVDRRGRVRADPPVLAAVALGGALGAPARYRLAQLAHVAPGSFPWATFATNVTGSFALGLVLALVIERFPPTRYLRPFVATGFLGAYTTYSTFAVETDLLVKDGHAALAFAYATASLVCGLVAAAAGLRTARALPLPSGSDRR